MTDERCNLQKIDWAETFPFVRLFATSRQALSFWPMLLAFLCVLLTYASGRVLDVIWTGAGGGVLSSTQTPSENEIFAYADLDSRSFETWKTTTQREWDRDREAETPEEVTKRAAQTERMLALIAERLKFGLTSLENNQDYDADEKQNRRDELEQAADVLNLELSGYDSARVGLALEPSAASRMILDADPSVSTQENRENRQLIETLISRPGNHPVMKLRGPFISLLNYEMHCFAAAIQGVCNGRWGFSGSAVSDEPAMLGSVASAGSGVFWLATQRPCFAVFLTLTLLLLFSYFGGAICRLAAVRSAREESLSGTAALKFSCRKWGAALAAPLLPAAAFIFVGLCILVGGLIAAVWGLHTIVALFYPLTLIGGVVLMFIFLVVVTGFHLLWPTLAVEGSDTFDAIQRAAGYVFGRPWHTAFYSFVLLLYGGVSFVMVRIIGMLVLKFCHSFTGAGMNLAGNVQTSTIGKLDAIWRMPAWQDLPLLPATGNVTFWGSFLNAPLSGAESFTAFFLMCSVFTIVGLVGAYAVSFYFCGSTQMYFLLRRDVDAVDYDELYYEEPEDELDEDDFSAAEPHEPESALTPAKSGESEAAEAPPAVSDKPADSVAADHPKKSAGPKKTSTTKKTTRSKKTTKSKDDNGNPKDEDNDSSSSA